MLNRERTRELRDFAVEQRPVVLFTGGCLSHPVIGRPAGSLLRQLGSRVRGVVDDRHEAQTIGSVAGLEGFEAVPVRDRPDPGFLDGADLVVAMDLPADTRLVDRHRRELIEVADSGRQVWNTTFEPIRHRGVHDLCVESGAERCNAEGAAMLATSIACLPVDRSMSTLDPTIAIRSALLTGGCVADWLPASPAGVLIRGYGRCIDAASAAFASGVVEQLMSGLETSAGVIVVEGVGSLLDVSGASSIAATIHGARSRYHVLCHRVEEGDEDLETLLAEAAGRCDAMYRSAGVRSILLGVWLDTTGLADTDAQRAAEDARSLGVVVVHADDASLPPSATPIVAAFDAMGAGAGR